MFQLQSVLLNKPEKVPFNVIQYVAGEVIYGGTF
jgi:hypothetical protein